MDALPDDLLSRILALLPDDKEDFLDMDEDFGGVKVSSRQAPCAHAGWLGSEQLCVLHCCRGLHDPSADCCVWAWLCACHGALVRYFTAPTCAAGHATGAPRSTFASAGAALHWRCLRRASNSSSATACGALTTQASCRRCWRSLAAGLWAVWRLSMLRARCQTCSFGRRWAKDWWRAQAGALQGGLVGFLHAASLCSAVMFDPASWVLALAALRGTCTCGSALCARLPLHAVPPCAQTGLGSR